MSKMYADLERNSLADGKVTSAEIEALIQSLGEHTSKLSKSAVHDVDMFMRRVAKLDASTPNGKAPPSKKIRPLRALANTATLKLAGLAWTLVKGHLFIGGVGAYGYSKKSQWRGTMAMVCASWLLFKQWELARASGQNWLKHKMQLMVWQSMIRMLSLPIDIPVWIVKKINAGVRSKKSQKKNEKHRVT